MGQQVKKNKQITPVNILNSGRCYIPEWENQESVWLAWPHNKNEWKENLGNIRKFYEELITVLLRFQNDNLIFPDVDLLCETSVKAIHQLPQQLKKIIIPNNDIWIRDYGPFFIKELEGRRMVLDFEFNAWGGKFPPWNLDNNVPREIALYKGSEIESYPLVLEGGALEFSGDGIALTTEECVLSETRNKNISKHQTEEIIKRAFNLKEIIWLKNGLANDHTDGHIDNVARFIDSQKILICKSEKKNENYDRLQPSIESLKDYKFEIIEIPLPEGSEELPKSYANFIFVNGGIIVPTFSCKTDEKVLEIFKKLFPKREIVGIDCSVLIEQGGGLHCMTKQEPFIAD